MNKFYEQVKKLDVLKSAEFIYKATVPVIKLTADLKLVQEQMIRKHLLEQDSDDEVQQLPFVKLDSQNEMRVLNIDITFDGIGSQQHCYENP